MIAEEKDPLSGMVNGQKFIGKIEFEINKLSVLQRLFLKIFKWEQSQVKRRSDKQSEDNLNERAEDDDQVLSGDDSED